MRYGLIEARFGRGMLRPAVGSSVALRYGLIEANTGVGPLPIFARSSVALRYGLIEASSVFAAHDLDGEIFRSIALRPH